MPCSLQPQDTSTETSVGMDTAPNTNVTSVYLTSYIPQADRATESPSLH